MDEHSVLWNGILCVKGAYACPAQLTSMTYFSLPGELGRCLNLKWQWKNISTLTSYLNCIPEAGMLCDREVFAKGWYFNSCSLKPLDSRERFARIKDHLHSTGSISVVKVGEDILLVTPDTKMTEDLGLMQDDQCLHCLVLSRHSRVSSAPKCQTMSDGEEFLNTPPASSLITKDNLHQVFDLRNRDHCSVTLYQDHYHHNKIKKSSSDEKRVAQSVDEHPERKRHKSEHSSCVTGSLDIPMTPLTKHDKLKSKRKRHRSETPRKRGINTSPSVQIVTDETIRLQSHDKFSCDSSKVWINSSTVKIGESEHEMVPNSSHKKEKENVKNPLSVNADDEKQEKDGRKKQHFEDELFKRHHKMKTKVVEGEKKTDKSREKEHTSKKHLKNKVAKLTVLEKKQLESEKVLSQLNLSHAKENFSSLGRIPKKKPNQKCQSSNTMKNDTGSTTEKKKECSSKKEKTSSSEKKKNMVYKRGRTEKDIIIEKEGGISISTDHKQDSDKNVSDSELPYERDNIWDNLCKFKYHPASGETPFLLSKEKCFESIKDDYQAFTSQKIKNGGASIPIPGFGDLDKLRMIECKERHTKVKRYIRKTEDGLQVKIKDNEKGLELWNNVDCFTAFVKLSLHRMNKYECSLTDIDAFQQLWAEKIHKEEFQPNSERKATVDKSNPYDIKIQIQLLTDLGRKSRKTTITESSTLDIHIQLQDEIGHASEETEQNTDLLKSNKSTEDEENFKGNVSRKNDKIDNEDQSKSFVKDKENVCEKKSHLSYVPENKPKNESEMITSKSPILGQVPLKPDQPQTTEKVELNEDIPSPKQMNMKPNLKTELVSSITFKEDIKTSENEITSHLKKAEEKSKPLKNESEEITCLKNIKDRTERRNSGERSKHVSGSRKSNNNIQFGFNDMRTDTVSTGCELSEKRESALREGSLQQRLGKIADMTVPADKKSKKSDKRLERQFHPYKKDDRPKRSNVPTWSFDIAYQFCKIRPFELKWNFLSESMGQLSKVGGARDWSITLNALDYSDMEELLQNMTENMFKVEYRKPADVRKWRKGTCRTSLGSVKGRFYGHRFTRSKVPDSLPNYSEAREEEYDINPELISNMEERARQADIVEESWQNVPKEETSFIEEMCIYGQDKEEVIDKSNKEENKSVQRIVKPDVSLVIPGIGKTSLYSGEDLSDMEETNQEFLQDNNGGREKLEAILSPKIEKNTKDKEKKGEEIFNIKKESNKVWHEFKFSSESQLKRNISCVILENKAERIDHNSSCHLKPDKGRAEDEKETHMENDETKINLLVKAKCFSAQERHPSPEKSKSTQSTRHKELCILSSDSDICLDWSDEDILKEEAELEDHNDDETFVVIDTVEDYGSDTPENKKETQGCRSNTQENQEVTALDYLPHISQNSKDNALDYVSHSQENLKDNTQGYRSDTQKNQKDSTQGCRPHTQENQKETTQVSGSHTGIKNQNDTTLGYGSDTQESQKDTTQDYSSNSQKNNTDATEGCWSQTQGNQKVVAQSCGSHTKENQIGVTQGCGSHTQENQIGVTQGCGSHTQENHLTVTQHCGSHTHKHEKDVTQGCGSRAQENQKDTTQGCGSPKENLKDTTEGCCSQFQENQKSTTQGFDSQMRKNQKGTILGCGSFFPTTCDTSEENKKEEENNDGQIVSTKADPYNCNQEPVLNKKLVPYICESDGNDTEDEYNSDFYSTVDEVTDCENSTHPGLEEVLAIYRHKVCDPSSKVSISKATSDNETVEELDSDYYCLDVEVLKCNKSNLLNPEKLEIKRSLSLPQVFFLTDDSQTHSTDDNTVNSKNEIKHEPDTKCELFNDCRNSFINATLNETCCQSSTVLEVYNDKESRNKQKSLIDVECKEDYSGSPVLLTEDNSHYQNISQKNTDAVGTTAEDMKDCNFVPFRRLEESTLIFASGIDDVKKQEEIHKIDPLVDKNLQTNVEKILTPDFALMEKKSELNATASGQENCLYFEYNQAGGIEKEFVKNQDFSQTDTTCSFEKDHLLNNLISHDDTNCSVINQEISCMSSKVSDESHFSTKHSPITEILACLSTTCNDSVISHGNVSLVSVTDQEFTKSVIDSKNKENITLKSGDEVAVTSLNKRCLQHREKIELIEGENGKKLETDDKAKEELMRENQAPDDYCLNESNKAYNDNLEQNDNFETIGDSSNKADFVQDFNVVNNSITHLKSPNPSKEETVVKAAYNSEKIESKLKLAYREFQISLALDNKETNLRMMPDVEGKEYKFSQWNLEKQNHVVQENKADEDTENEHDTVINTKPSQDEEPEIIPLLDITTDDDSQISEQNILQEPNSSDLEQISNNESFNSETQVKILDEYNSDSSKSITDSEKQYAIKIKPIDNPDRFQSPEYQVRNDQINVVKDESTSFLKPSPTWESFYSDKLSNNNDSIATKNSYNISDLLKTNLSTLRTKVKKKKKLKNKLRSDSPSTQSLPNIPESSYSAMSTTPLVSCSVSTLPSRSVISTASSYACSSILSSVSTPCTATSCAVSPVTTASNALYATSMNVPSSTTVISSLSNTTTSAVSSASILSNSPTISTINSGPRVLPISPASSDSTLNTSISTTACETLLSNITTSHSLFNFHPYNSAEWGMVAPYSPYPGYGVYPTAVTTAINNTGTHPSQNFMPHTLYNYSSHDYNLWYSSYNTPAQHQQWYGSFYPMWPFRPGPSGNRRGALRPRSRMHSYWNSY